MYSLWRSIRFRYSLVCKTLDLVANSPHLLMHLTLGQRYSVVVRQFVYCHAAGYCHNLVPVHSSMPISHLTITVMFFCQIPVKSRAEFDSDVI
jgi:hypothetical protein